MRKWKLLEHTADLRIEGRGEDRAGALGALVEGLLNEIHGGEAIPAVERSVRYGGVDLTDTAVGLLGEVLYLVYGEHWLPARCEVASLTPFDGELVLWGEPESERSRPRLEVKAATFHGFAFAQEGGETVVRAVFDV